MAKFALALRDQDHPQVRDLIREHGGQIVPTIDSLYCEATERDCAERIGFMTVEFRDDARQFFAKLAERNLGEVREPEMSFVA